MGRGRAEGRVEGSKNKHADIMNPTRNQVANRQGTKLAQQALRYPVKYTRKYSISSSPTLMYQVNRERDQDPRSLACKCTNR